jgi:CRP-like cAMP-binding protein/SAM-dependent methyltransferase
MQEALELLADLDEADVDWIFANGLEQQVVANHELTTQGKLPDALHIVLEGLLGVRVRGAELVGQIGPGGVVGEMSFLEGQPASATVQAVESSLLLTLSRSTLNARLTDDPAFASRIYRAFARSLSRRLRLAHAARSRVAGQRDPASQGDSRWEKIDASLSAFKLLLSDADHRAIKNEGVVPDELAAEIQQRFNAFSVWLNEQIGDGSSESPEVRQELGARVQRELLPWLMLTKNGERWYAKPRGYAGDFLAIEWIYEDTPEGTGRLGPVLDRCFLDMPGARAVKNRRRLLAEEIARTVGEAGGEPARVLSMSCGPARELFDVFDTLPDPSKLIATCLDIDLQALAFVADQRDRRKQKPRIRLENSNLVYLAAGRQKLDVPPQDLAYSAGLIDYFNDTFVIRILDFVYDLLKPGGRVILGNFHPRNPNKAVMDYVVDWKLIHRDEGDMNWLFQSSKFGAGCDRIFFEEQGVNLFAVATRR